MLRWLSRFVAVAAAIACWWPADGHAHGLSAAQRQAMLDGGYLQYMWLGATHMLTGYDHLLFLFAVVFFLTRPAAVISHEAMKKAEEAAKPAADEPVHDNL